MFSPRIKQLVFKLLLILFVPDRLAVYRRHVETRMAQEVMRYLSRAVTPADLQEARLAHLAERMGDLQQAICRLIEKGFTREEIAGQLDVPLQRVQRQLDLIEREIYRMTRYMK